MGKILGEHCSRTEEGMKKRWFKRGAAILLTAAMIAGLVPDMVAVQAASGGYDENGFCTMGHKLDDTGSWVADTETSCDRGENCSGYEPAVLTKDKYDLDGNGTKDEVYEISNAGQLYWYAQLVNVETASANAVLTQNIVINENLDNMVDDEGMIISGGSVRTWNPIGNSDTHFSGIFDGKNHIIAGLCVDADSSNNQGLFGITDGTVRNVVLKNASIRAYASIGGYVD